MDANPRTRRQVLTVAIAAAGGALAARAATVTEVAEAANGATVKVGQSFSGTATTSITNTAASATAVALKGVVSTTGSGHSTAGVWGQSAGQSGNGVFGYATDTGNNTKGVWGRSTNGKGVYGEATGTSGVNYGVYGTTESPSGYGVYGTGIVGVFGSADAIGVKADAPNYGVYATSGNIAVGGTGHWGVHGFGNHTGVRGDGGTYGVLGSGDTYGAFGAGDTYGVYGDGGIYGLRGVGGTYGAYLTGTSYGLYASAPSYAGWFNGKVHVTGALEKPGGSFLIDHPMDPANRTLEHSFVEAPERLHVYRGNVTLDGRGRATVRMPRYFRALNSDYSYQLTPIGAPAPDLHVARTITRSSFAIAGGAAEQEVCWQVTGARRDAWAQANPLRVERRKRPRDRGSYLNPEVHGRSRSAAINRPPKERRPRVPRVPKRPRDA